MQSRIFNKLLTFAHGIKANGRAPFELKSYLYNTVVPADEPDELATEQYGIKDNPIQTKPTLDVYTLRKGRIIEKNIIPDSKFGKLTFKNFFPRLLKTFNKFDFHK